ncbi:acetate/propionate family kinase [Methylomonas sp. ZR1]|uniref:acetate/propionate family kinase n=1 Tax=Methylomonas sp. ZR1 TaxID=1797072 RepID=UPI001492EF70|nr:acetate kinase [Methylomonas sp. ZR1]NOV30318.1 acetate kinase [Methylomonas sp. ZR1]
MKILVLNAGSSSVKYSLFEMSDRSVLIAGIIERIGEDAASHSYALANNDRTRDEINCRNHQQALQLLFETLAACRVLTDRRELAGIGHRVVHGGEHFREPALIDAQVMQRIAEVIPLAPLHNPANLLGIEEAIRQMDDTPQVAVFDTAFHQTLPDYAYRYAVPNHLYTDHGVRRYGFHGTSHRYVAEQAAQYLSKPLSETNLITLHLGNGASVTAIQNGRSIDTSMGMTPLEGLMMGSRCGDIDPAIHFYLSRTLNLSNEAIETLLNKESGCKGVCGENDMRAIHRMVEAGDDHARLALAMYAYRIKKYIGAYFAALGRVDALVFTGGIGENDAWLREHVCLEMQIFGIALDPERNQKPVKPCDNISPANAGVAILVIATNEELEIAIQAQQCLEQKHALN